MAVSEAAALAAMRAWRRGAGPLRPWFRATPFAAAHHYPERVAGRVPRAMPAAAARVLAALPAPAADTLWIVDLAGPLAIWTAFGLRARHGMATALGFNGWYDPRGVLDGREEIPLLLGLAARLPARVRPRLGCLVLDARRAAPVEPARAPAVLDNRYALGEEDAPAVEQIREAGWRRVCVFVEGAPAPDLQPYVDYLAAALAVEVHAVSAPAAREAAAHG